MAVGLSAAMVTSKSSLLAMQEALAVTSNNISHATDSSYHKQSINFTDNVEILDVTGYYGTGVSVASITRTYNSALESSLSAANTTDGYNQTSLEYSTQVENLIAPDGESTMIDDMSAFMDAIQDVETNPEDSTYREEFISAAKTIGDSLNASYASLGTINAGIATWDESTVNTYTDGSGTTISHNVVTSGTAADATAEVNSLLDQIVTLNEQISNLETYDSSSTTANDLRDSRDALVQSLSTYIGVDVSEGNNGRYTITDSNGTILVGVSGTGTSNYKSYANTVNAEFADVSTTSAYDTIEFAVYTTSGGVTTRTTLDGTGELGAYSDSYDYVTDEMKKIYNLDYTYGSTTTPPYPGYAQALAEAVNTTLALGYKLDGTQPTVPTDNLFVSDYATTGSVLSVNSSYTADDVAACYAATAADFAQGDGTNMQDLWDSLNSTKVPIYTSTSGGVESSGSYTLAGYPNTYVNDIATVVSNDTSNADTSEATVTMYANAIASASGVSSDTELTNMLSIQQAYAASAKVISTIQSMYDSIFAAV